MESGCQSRVHIKTTFSPFLILPEAKPLCVTRNGKFSILIRMLNNTDITLMSVDNKARTGIQA